MSGSGSLANVLKKNSQPALHAQVSVNHGECSQIKRRASMVALRSAMKDVIQRLGKVTIPKSISERKDSWIASRLV
jgi:hypothetical protein